MTEDGEDRGYLIKMKEIVTQDSKEEREVNIELDPETIKRVVRPWLSQR
jgi:hypothetical protein